MNGVIILSLKKPAYSCAAFNLALSIKYHNSSINITLLSDGEHKDNYRPENYAVFDWIKQIDREDAYHYNGRFEPAKAKINLSKYSTYENTLYIDADSICIQNIEPLFRKLAGSAFKSNLIDGYTQWTDEETYKEFFGLSFGKTINTSWIYWEKTEVFEKAQEFYAKDFPLDKVVPVWGGSYPDELFFNGAINALQVDPKIDFEIMFFGNNIDPRRFDELENDFYFFTLYGNRTTVRKIYIDWYDRLMFKMCQSFGLEHKFKAHEILTGKHVSNKIHR